jgi:hypothetical protein
MTDPERPDAITDELSSIMANFIDAPIRSDLAAISPAVFVHGLMFGFDDWWTVRAVANSRRHVQRARQVWSDEHPTQDYLERTVSTSERGIGHRTLLERAHPDCSVCAGVRDRLAGASDAAATLGAIDDIDAEWLILSELASADLVRGRQPVADVAWPLSFLDPGSDSTIRITRWDDRIWEIYVTNLDARAVSVHLRWSDGTVVQRSADFDGPTVRFTIESPTNDALPEMVRFEVSR